MQELKKPKLKKIKQPLIMCKCGQSKNMPYCDCRRGYTPADNYDNYACPIPEKGRNCIFGSGKQAQEEPEEEK